MQSIAMDRFETILNFAVDPVAGDKSADLKAEILKAADKLLEDSAMEMAQSSLNGILILLLTVYKTGQAPPGKSPNPHLNELVEILVGKAKNADHSAEDTY